MSLAAYASDTKKAFRGNNLDHVLFFILLKAIYRQKMSLAAYASDTKKAFGGNNLDHVLFFILLKAIYRQKMKQLLPLNARYFQTVPLK